jgi:hypothetical protein
MSAPPCVANAVRTEMRLSTHKPLPRKMPVIMACFGFHCFLSLADAEYNFDAGLESPLESPALT